MQDHILIRYGELALKKSNRNQFINRIISNIKRNLKDYQDLSYENRSLRFYIHLNGTNPDKLIEILKTIPGIHSFSIVSKTLETIDDVSILCKTLLEEELKNNTNLTFKIETNRGDKDFPMSSLEISKEVSIYLFRNIPNLHADMHNPDVTINIDFRKEGAFVYTNVIEGMGGMPSGTIGKASLMISGGIDSVVAGYLALKKGIQLDCIHFASPPYTSSNAVQKVIDLLEVLTKYTEYQNINLYIVPFTTIQKKIYEVVREDYGITIMRRMMYIIAEKLSIKLHNIAIINGENIGQVASQTLESMATIEEVCTMPIIRPLATLDKLDIVKIAKDINTFPISIRPYEDCCTVFVPKHPQIRPNKEYSKKEESLFDYEHLIDEAVQNVEKITLYSDKHHLYIGEENIF